MCYKSIIEYEKKHYSPDVSEISESPELIDTFLMTPDNIEKGRMAYV